MAFPFPRTRNAFNKLANQAHPAQTVREAFALEAGCKDAALGKTSNDTLAADPDLTIPDIIAGVPYQIEVYLPVTSTANGSIQLDQAGGTCVADTYTGYTQFQTAAGAATTVIDVSALNTAQDPTNAAFVRVQHRAILIASTGGSFAIQWAQSDSHTDTTTVGKGAYVTATPLTALTAR